MSVWRWVVLVVTMLITGCASLPEQYERSDSFALQDTASTALGQAGREPLQDHPGQSAFRPLPGGVDALVARMVLAEAAERSLDVQYYIWHDDLTGRLFAHALLRAADRGVRVRILVDDVGTKANDEVLLSLDAHPQIEVRLFNPVASRTFRGLGMLSDFSRTNRRMHNKSFVADNQRAVLGGRNIGDEYFEAHGEVAFGDLDVLTLGPVVAEVSEAFDLFWNAPMSIPIGALTGRLLTLAETRRGPPPVPYAWIAYGSQGRHELTLNSDQDNALILADGFDASHHGAYFAQLARDVCDGLAACGLMHCPGEMMASNPRWRQPLAGWSRLFSDWIEHTDRQKARLASNLFDFRVVHGDEQLGRPLRRQIARNCPRHDTLFVHLVANACSTPPPLGFFRQLVVIREGEHEGDLDIKRHGLLPIVDLARIHALAAGVRETGTLPRLRAAAAGKLLSRDGAETLGAAFEFLLALRTRHQKEQLSRGLRADNFLAPATLSAGDRQSLRDVFLAIARQQKALQLAFPHPPAR